MVGLELSPTGLVQGPTAHTGAQTSSGSCLHRNMHGFTLEGHYLLEHKCNYLVLENDSILILTSEDPLQTHKSNINTQFTTQGGGATGFHLIRFSLCLFLKCDNGKHMFSMADHQGSLILYQSLSHNLISSAHNSNYTHTHTRFSCSAYRHTN